MNLPKFAIQRPVTICMIFLGTIIMGFLALQRLPIELMPNASFGTITIFIGVRGGLPPPEIENSITKIVEEAVATVSNLENIISSSKKDRSVVTLEFKPGIDMDYAAQEVRENFSKIKNKLPREIEKPIIAKYEESDVPVMIVGMTGSKYTPEMIRRIVDETLKEQLLQIEGVANIEVGGGRERKILVELDESRLQAYQIPVKKVLNVLSQSNIDLLSGEVDRSRDVYTVRTTGSFKTVEDIGNIHVVITPDKSIIRLRDIAEVKDSYLEAESYSRLNQRDSVSLYIQKESNSNTVKVAERLKKKIDSFKKEIDPDIKMTIVSDQAKFIVNSIKTVKSSLFLGAFLAALILYLFLRDIRHTLVVTTVIPISVMITFFAMYVFGITLNVMSLSGLALGIGMLVDNSIVVIENIFRHRAPYLTCADPDNAFARQTAISGAQEMILAIIASTVTTIVVFLPITFINKQVRILYSDLSFTVIVSLCASLFVALSILPLMESAISIRQKKSRFFVTIKEYKGALIKKTVYPVRNYFRSICGVPENHPNGFAYVYDLLLLYALKKRITIYLVLLVLFVVSLYVFAYHIDKEFIASAEQNEFTIFVELPSGTKLDISDEIVAAIEQKLNELPELKKFLKSTQSRVEGWSSKVYVSLVEKKDRARSTAEIIASLRPQLQNIGKEFDSFIYFSEPQTSRELIIDVFGYDYKQLAEIATSIANQMGDIQGLQDIKLRYRPGQPEAKLVVDKIISSYLGLSIRHIAEVLHAKVRGMRASYFHTEAKEVEIIPRVQEQYRRNVEDIKHLVIYNERGERAFIDQIVQLVFDLSPSEIWRKNKQRMIQVSASLERISMSKAAEKSKTILNNFSFPRNYFANIGGDFERMVQNEKEFLFAFAISIILVYAVLAALFESYIQPFIILITVPMGGIGVILILYLTIHTVTMGVFIGMLMLGGIVVNNAIILIDRINQVVRESPGMVPDREALKHIVVSTSKVRLRPILMTTLTTLLGLIPMAVDRSEGAAMWRPLAITVIGGYSVSTVLTLFAIPGLYIIFEDLKDFLGFQSYAHR